MSDASHLHSYDLSSRWLDRKKDSIYFHTVNFSSKVQQQNMLLSIGLPFYNNEQTIVSAIKSIFAQTIQDWELILVDDGSTDRSLEIVRELSDPRIRILSDGCNKGLSHRLNQIATLAKGAYLARMDGDDLMWPDRLEKQLAFLQANPGVDVVGTGCYSIDQHTIPSGKRGCQSSRSDLRYVLCNGLFIHGSVMGKRSWFLKNPYDPEYIRAEDHELWCRTFMTSSFKQIEEPLYILREGKINIENYSKSAQTVREILNRYGQCLLPPLSLVTLMVKSRLKVGIYRLFALARWHDLLSRRRNTPITRAEKVRVASTIAAINNVTLPLHKATLNP